GLDEYSDAAAHDSVIKRVRELVKPVGDPSITEDQSNIEVELQNGTVLKQFVECSLGNIRRPLSDAQLEEKFRDQAPLPQVDRLIEMFWKMDGVTDVNDVVKATWV